jgi:ubiquinone/menaquinone biosynthesis C-methylase UbiE
MKALVRQLVPESLKTILFSLKEGSYRKSWNRLSSGNVIKEIIGWNATESEFDKAGEQDAIWIRNVIGENKKVLDVGCGMGRLEKYLSAFCSSIEAVDVSPKMLKLASDRLGKIPNVSFSLVDDDCKLPKYETGSFDAVISLLVLEHLDKEDAFRYLIEFNRVLRKDGVCIIQFPNLCSDVYFDSFIENVKSHAARRRKARVRFYTSQEVMYMLDKAGFSCVSPQCGKEDSDIRVVACKVSDAYVTYPFIKYIK